MENLEQPEEQIQQTSQGVVGESTPPESHLKLILIIGLIVIFIASVVYFYVAKYTPEPVNETAVVKEEATETTEVDESEEVGGVEVADGWEIRSVVAGNNRIVFHQPRSKNIVFEVSVVEKSLDNVPENFPINTIGGQVYDLEEFELNDITISSYNFITSTGYGWMMMELPLDNGSHIEMGHSSKGDDQRFTQEEWGQIINTVQLQQDVEIYSFEGDVYEVIDKNTLVFDSREGFGGPARLTFEADLNTFEIVDDYYAKDNKNVFYTGYELENADPQTFEFKEVEVVGNSESIYGGVNIDNKYYSENIPQVKSIAVDAHNVYSKWQWLEDVSPTHVKIEIGNGMGSIISDEDTNWYFKGNCHGGSYITEEEMIPSRFDSKEKYLDEYTFC